MAVCSSTIGRAALIAAGCLLIGAPSTRSGAGTPASQDAQTEARPGSGGGGGGSSLVPPGGTLIDGYKPGHGRVIIRYQAP